MTIDRADFPDDARLRWVGWQKTLLSRWYGFAKSKDVPSGDRADLVQEVARRALEHHRDQPFPSIHDAARWGATVLKNLLVDQAEHEGRHPEVEWDDVPENELGTLLPVDEIVEKREVARLIREALDDLHPAYRAAICARYFDDLTYREAATLFGISETTFGVRVHRGLLKLRLRLANLGLQFAPTPLLTYLPARRWRADHPLLPAFAQGVAAGAMGLALAVTSALHGAPPVPIQATGGTSVAGTPTGGEPVEPVLRIGSDEEGANVRVRTPTGAPHLDALLCVGIRDDPVGLCLTSDEGGPGHRAYVRMPTKSVLGEDRYLDVEQSVVPVCRSMPETDYTGCAPPTEHPDPASERTPESGGGIASSGTAAASSRA